MLVSITSSHSRSPWQKLTFWILLILCFGVLASGCQSSVEDENTKFEEKFYDYVERSIQSIDACTTKTCLTNLKFPIFVTDDAGDLKYWNEAAMTLRTPNSAQSIVDHEGDLFYIYQKNELTGLIPILYQERKKQQAFLCDHIDKVYRYSSYEIAKKDLVPVDQILSKISLNFSLGGKYILLLFFLLAFLFFIVLRSSDQLLKYFGYWQGATMVILALTAIRLLFSLPIIAESFAHHVIFRHHLRSSFLSPSLGELFLNMLLFFVITIFLFKSFDNRPQRKYTSVRRWALLVTGYLLVMMSIISFVYVVKRVVIHSSISFQFDKIYALDWNTHIFILSILLFVCSLFFLSYLLIKILSKTGARLDQRLIAFFIATLLTFPVFLNFSLHVSSFGFYIFVLSVLVLMDLFVESKQKSISWLVLWLVTISSGTTALLYSHNSVAFFKKATEFAHHIGSTYQANPEFEIDNFSNPGRFQYAIYDGYDIVQTSGNPTPFELNDVEMPALGRTKRADISSHKGLLYRHAPGTSIYVNRKQDHIIQFISLFSFLFTSLTLVILLIFFLNFFFRFIPSNWNLKIGKGQSIRRRIQYVIFSMLILSFTTVFAVTSFYLRDFRDGDRASLSIQQRQSLNFLSTYLKEKESDRFNPNAKSMQAFYENGHSIFDMKGKSILAQEYQTFQHPPFSLTNIDSTTTTDAIVVIDKGQQTGAFKRIATQSGQFIIGVTDKSLNQDTNYFVNNLLGTLLNLYIFLFVIASSLALTFSDSITRPLLKLREKFSSVRIGRGNEPIDWHSNDELGQLINDYNRMIAKIEESVHTLAMTERELAWREMAKQVAHEIKNPLTPMKLSLQHLQMAIKRDPHRAQELMERVGNTLLEQIENLSRIASEFSNFAKMPKPENKQVILNDIASSVHDLFRKREDMDINLYIPIDEIYVFGDHHYMTRVLINLLKNATQAIPNDRRGIIDIHVYKDQENAIIKVIDNGTGIPLAIQDKVFQPNFTSKNSGTGLGLAICANIVESFNGKIYFETEEEKGTTFFIEIPLMHMADNFKKEEHVIL